MIRTYGKTPYTTAVIHGGPGNPGSLADVAQKLATFTGVIEPIQTQYSIPELIEELNQQLCSVSQYPFVLLGHSWGAWLAILYAAKYPQMVKQLILVGSGPFEEQFVSQIMTRRISKLSDKERILFKQLLNQLGSNENINKKHVMAELGLLIEKSDNVQVDPDLHNPKYRLPADGVMYSAIWPQAEKIRKNGILVESLLKIRCPIAIIHGEEDPHPIEGVTNPLLNNGLSFQEYILPQCGHSPFKEKFVHQTFYQIIEKIISGTD